MVNNTFTMNYVFLMLVLLGMHLSHQQFVTDVDCFLESNKGYTYKGNVSTRENGQLCKKWINQPFEGYNEDHNFCRNPKGNVYKPWCYSAYPLNNDLWGYCKIPYCDTDCLREADNGSTYNGIVSSIDQNLAPPCVNWTDVINNSAGYREAHNFCRNPSNRGKPWCYTSVTGNWSYCNIASCALIKCKTYPEIDNTIRPPVRPEGYTYLETINITCQNGYYVNGTSGIECGTMGNWSTPYPLCIGQSCQEFPNIQNANPLNKTVGYRHPDNVTVTCQTGYDINGSFVVMCNAGNWSLLPTCLGKPCSEFPNINNTIQINKTLEYRHPDTVTVTCQTGYEMNGSSVVQCNAGNWSTFPSCIAKPCNTFPYIVNAIQPNKTEGYRHLDTVNVTCQTGYNMSGSEIVQCYAGFWIAVPECRDVYKPSSPSSLSAGPVAGGVVGAAVLFLIVVGVIMFLKRRRYPQARPKQYVEREDHRNASHADLDPTIGMYAQVKKQGKDTVYLNTVDRDNGGYYEFSCGPQIPQNAIKIKDYYDYVETEREEGGKIEAEFLKLKPGLQKPTTAALKPGNKLKNKYKDMYAYDESRVVLEELDGSKSSDYINASFVSGPNQIRKYIASQGPIDKTVDDFWRMVWQYDCGKIVMLTNVVEDGKQKCVHYWPASWNEKINFGLVDVVLLHEDVYSDFTVRTLAIHKGNEKKRINQFHFTAWPDKDVPKYASSLVHFRHKVNSTKVATSGPMIVHCSAGVGRTGTYIGLDYVVDQAKEHSYVDVFACVEGLRNQRVNMVQTARQYVFLHDAILEALMCPNSGIPARDFSDTYKELLRFDDLKKKHKLQIEYEIMNKISPRHEKDVFEKGKMSINKHKNRYSNILPVRSEMPLLSTAVDGHNEYINAVFLPGHRNSKAFIITQMPLQSTCIDLWRLVYDYEISTIIVLNQYNQTEDTEYWPGTDVPVSYGPFNITQASSQSTERFKSLTFMLKYKKVQKRVNLFQCTFWDDNDVVPKSANDVFALMTEIESTHDAKTSGPILVQCLNGCDKSGLYCVLATVIERLRIEQDVDIQHIIKQMRNRRPQIIPNYEQFQFLYEAVLEYLKQFSTYSNFQ